VKTLSLRPYHGDVLLFESLDQLREAYTQMTGDPYPYDTDPKGGCFVRVAVDDDLCETKWLVFAATPHALAHEFAHVLLHTCAAIGHNPTVGDGEPFCYMLSQLISEAA
jgi:hypothetical protein